MYGYVTECFDILFVLLQTFNEQAHYRHCVHARTFKSTVSPPLFFFVRIKDLNLRLT